MRFLASQARKSLRGASRLAAAAEAYRILGLNADYRAGKRRARARYRLRRPPVSRSGSAAEARVLFVPLRARAAHVVQFGLVRTERQPEATQQFEGTEKKHDPADKNEG
jgi:hypothetical protein